MKLNEGCLIVWFLYILHGSVTAEGSNIGSTATYFRSVAMLCGWAECQGFCQQRNASLPVTRYHNSADNECTTTKFSSRVQGALECPSNNSVCVTQNTFRQGCTPSADSRTACFSLYLNISTNKFQTKVCWDHSHCMDLVLFCRQQKSFSCTNYGSMTIPPVIPTTATPPTPTKRTNPEKTSKAQSAQPGRTVPVNRSPTAAPVNGQPKAFLAGIIIGVGVAVIPIIIVASILLFMRKKLRREFQVRHSTKRNESICMSTEGPVYASIGPEVPPKPPGSQTLGPSFLHLPVSSGITSSAKSLHISGKSGSVLVGNLQRNKSLPALAYAVNSIPMESNEMLRAVAHNNQRSRSTSSPQSPDSLADQVSSTNHGEAYKIPSTSQPLASPSRDAGDLSPVIDNSRVISVRDSGRGLTNKLYSEAVLPGPPSTYSQDETRQLPQQYVNLTETNDHMLPDPAYAPIQRPNPGSPKQDNGPSSGGQYMGLESTGGLTSPSEGQYMGLVECGPGNVGTPKLDADNHDELSSNGAYAGLELVANSQYMGLDTGTMSSPATNGYMGLMDATNSDDKDLHKVPFSDGAYMGLQGTNSTNRNHYMGIGDGSSECENRSRHKNGMDPPLASGTGAYSELDLLKRDDQQQGTYMGLTTQADETDLRKDSGASAYSYVDLDTNSTVNESITKTHDKNKTEKEKRADIARKKYWKSKSTFQKRKPSEDGLNTAYEGLQPQQKEQREKKTFLFKGKKRGKPSGKTISGEEDNDLCLDLKISTPPTSETAKPLYFTLDANSSTYGRCNGNKTGHDWTNPTGSVRETQQSCSNGEEGDEIFNLEGHFRPRSRSQPIQQSFSQYEEYETIEDK